MKKNHKLVIMHRKSFYYVGILFFIGCVVLTSNVVKGHAPSDITLSYNTTTQELSVQITHNVGTDSLDAHFMDSVVIKVDGSTVSTILYTSQPDPVTFTYKYTIVADEGATIQVTATCNFVGSLTKSLTVSSEPSSSSDANAISGYLGIWVIVGFSISSMLIIIYKKVKKGSI